MLVLFYTISMQVLRKVYYYQCLGPTDYVQECGAEVKDNRPSIQHVECVADDTIELEFYDLVNLVGDTRRPIPRSDTTWVRLVMRLDSQNYAIRNR